MIAQRGCFFALEGVDGSGKTTQLQLLREKFLSEGRKCVFTREPTEGPVGRLLRQILTGETRSDPRVAPLLFAADRLEHLLDPERGILAELERGSVVVTDRYYFSSYAYQSVDVPLEEIIAFNARAAELLRPTATVFIDLAPEAALERIRQNRERTELFETLERLTATREKYFEAFSLLERHENVLVFDGDKPPAELSGEIWATLKMYLS